MAERLERSVAAPTAHGGVLTAASETLRLSGIDDDINTSGRYRAVKPHTLGEWSAPPKPTTSGG